MRLYLVEDQLIAAVGGVVPVQRNAAVLHELIAILMFK